MSIGRTINYMTWLKGRKFGLGRKNELLSNGFEMTSPAVDASITVSAEGATVANQRDIVITLKDANGAAIDFVEQVELIVLLNAAGTDFVATGGSTGIEINGTGKLLAVVAKKVFKGLTSTAGVLAVKWTDTGTEAAYLGVKLPNGRIVISDALTNA